MLQFRPDLLICGILSGIGSRAIRPLLGIVDPLNVMTMPNRVAAYSAFDVFCHALESYTALPYNQRSPRPINPHNRPAYQVWQVPTHVLNAGTLNCFMSSYE